MNPTPHPEQLTTTDERTAALSIARELAAVGVPIFCCPLDPRAPTGVRLPRRWQHTEPDPAALDDWGPSLAVCAVTGTRTDGRRGLDVIDIDPRNGGDVTALLDAELMPTYYAASATPSGGMHLFVASLGIRKAKLATYGIPGIDYQAGDAGKGHGFVFLPPTERVSKTTGEIAPYLWMEPPSFGHVRRLIAGELGDHTGAPLLERITAGKPKRETSAKTSDDTSRVSRHQDTSGQSNGAAGDAGKDYAAYVAKALQTETEAIITAPEGTQNDTINTAAFNLGTLVGNPAFGLDRDVAHAILTEAARLGNHPADRAERTIESGLDSGIGQPRALPSESFFGFNVSGIGISGPGGEVTGIPAGATEDDRAPERPWLNVSNTAVNAEWIRENIGAGLLAGMFNRGDGLVHTPREGEEGYIPLVRRSPETAPGRFDHDGPAQIRPVTADYLSARVQYSYLCYKESKKGDQTVRSPAMFTREAAKVAINAVDMLPRLRRLVGVVHSPVLRPDGSVLSAPGYDPSTELLYLPEPGLVVDDVPESPTDDDVAHAVKVITEPIGEFPFNTDHDRANFIGAWMTPLLRTLTPPPYKLLTLEAHQPGSGKTLLANIIRHTHGGIFRSEMPEDDAELQKQVTTILGFTTGASVVFDNVSGVLKSSTLAGLLTSARWDNRVLGGNTLKQCANDRLWIVTGNNLTIGGDLVRRVLRVVIDPGEPHPELRTGFTIDNPADWVLGHRAEILHAFLVLIRSWVVAGRPVGAAMGSDGYAKWLRTVGGILTHAGISGAFHDPSTRLEIGQEDDEWRDFLTAVYDSFGTDTWTVRELLDRLDDYGVRPNGIPSHALPGDLESRAARNGPGSIAKSLGRWLMNCAGRWAGDLCVRVAGTDRSHVKRWRIHTHGGMSGNVTVTPEPTHPDETSPDSGNEPKTNPDSEMSETSQGSAGFADFAGFAGAPFAHGGARGGAGADAGTPAHAYAHARTRQPPEQTPQVPQSPQPAGESQDTHANSDKSDTSVDHPVIFDLETASAGDLYRYGPGFVRLAGWTGAGDGTHLSTDPTDLVARIERAPLVVGHNLYLGVDFPALARYHGLDIHGPTERGAVCDLRIAGRQFDPPMARETGVDHERRLDLDTLAERLGIAGKTGDLERLKKEHGGYDKIPTDHPDYRAYLERDVDITLGVYAQWAGHIAADPYIAREHRVQAIAAQMSLNGFRVDLELLEQRVAEGEARKAECLAELNGRWGIPLVNAKGTPHKSPLATAAGKAKLEEIFGELGITPIRTEKGALSIAGDAMDELRAWHPGHPTVGRLCELVKAVTGERTVYQTIHKALVDDRVHPVITMDQATGRWSFSQPGLTVLGKHGERYHERDVLLPDPGHVLLCIDFAQVDARAIAGHCQDPAYMAMFAPGVDLHAEVARRVWGDPGRRQDAKPLGHGWNYGMAPAAMAAYAGVPIEVAGEFDRAMTFEFPRLVQWREGIRRHAQSGQLMDNGFGRRMRPDPRRSHTQGPAFMGQGAARDICADGLLRLPREVYPYLRGFIHDEIVLSVPADIADDVERVVTEALSGEFYGVPIIADPPRRKDGSKIRGESWGACYAK